MPQRRSRRFTKLSSRRRTIKIFAEYENDLFLFSGTPALADAIYGLIQYPALAGMFASKGLEEVTNLKWNDAAAKIKTVYEAVIEENKKQ